MHATLVELQWQLEHLMFLSFSPSLKELAPWTPVHSLSATTYLKHSTGNLIFTFRFMKLTKGLVEDNFTQTIKCKIYAVLSFK